jgi:hypothetical protein
MTSPITLDLKHKLAPVLEVYKNLRANFDQNIFTIDNVAEPVPAFACKSSTTCKRHILMRIQEKNQNQLPTRINGLKKH